MTLVSFELVSESFSCEDSDPIPAYGLRVWRGEGSTAQKILECPDITTIREDILPFIELLERNEVSSCHILDVIEDYFWTS